MSYQNLSVSNNNYKNLNIKNKTSKSQKTKNESQTSQNLLDYEVNNELEELKNKIRSEIAKRQQSNLKHNILYIPPSELSTKEKINSLVEVEDGKKITHGLQFVLKSLLENKLCITKEILKLTCVEDVLKCKIKFRENLDIIALDLNATYKNTDDNNILFYRQQWRKVISELNELRDLQTSLDLKIKSIMLNSNISTNDNDFLKYTIALNSCQLEHQVKHTNYIKEVFREEVNVKDKFIHIMAQMLDMYNNVLRKNSLMTEQMSDSYCNMLHTAQGLGINTILADVDVSNISEVESLDSGISDAT